MAEEEDEDGVETSVALLTWTCAYIHVGQVVYRNQKVMSIGQTRESVAQYLHAQSRDAALRAVMNIGQFNPSIAPRAPLESCEHTLPAKLVYSSGCLYHQSSLFGWVKCITLHPRVPGRQAHTVYATRDEHGWTAGIAYGVCVLGMRPLS